ncbi:MAG: HAD family hydrolase, partial [Gammaproteobacteria bacterium]
MRPVLIDLDGTLIDGPTAESLFFDYLSRRSILKSKHYFAYFWFMARWFFRYGVAIKRVNKAYVAGMRRADVDVYAHSFVKNILFDLVRPEMWARIEEHQQQDDIIILLTEAPE